MRDVSSTDTEANFDIEQFVHTSGEGFGNDRPMDADNGSVDVAALGSVAGAPTVAGKKMSRKEKRQAKREVARLKKEAKLAEKEARKSYTSVKSQLKDRDKELTSKTADARRKREGAKDVVNYIGYNRMYQDGICEVEEGLFSSSISFGDTSYHSVRDEQQKSMFSALTRLYDQFGANTLVQMSVINTPLLKEEVGNGDDALVMHKMADGSREFIVAHGYDEETGHWGHGTYYDSLASTAADLESRTISDAGEEVICPDFWYRADIESALENAGLEVNDANVNATLKELGFDNGWLNSNFHDRLAEMGNEMIADAVDNIEPNGGDGDSPEAFVDRSISLKAEAESMRRASQALSADGSVDEREPSFIPDLS